MLPWLHLSWQSPAAPVLASLPLACTQAWSQPAPLAHGGLTSHPLAVSQLAPQALPHTASAAIMALACSINVLPNISYKAEYAFPSQSF